MKAVLLLAASLAWCSSQPPPIEPEPSPPKQYSCTSACDRERVLGCEEGEPTEQGASCEMVCENAASSPAPLDVACLSRAMSCADVMRCGD